MGMNTAFQKETAYKESTTSITFYSGNAVATIPTITDIPLIAYQVKVVVTGGDGATGAVAIVGTQAGVAASEDLAISGAGTYYSTKYYDLGTVPTITTTGLHNESPVPTLAISPVDPEHYQPINAVASFSVDWIVKTVEIKAKEGDYVKIETWFTTDTSLSVGDKIQYGGVEYSVETVFEVKNLARSVDHYKVGVL